MTENDLTRNPRFPHSICHVRQEVYYDADGTKRRGAGSEYWRAICRCGWESSGQMCKQDAVRCGGKHIDELATKASADR